MSMPDWIQQYKEKGAVPKSAGLLGKITEKDGFIPSAKNALAEEITAPQKIFGKDIADVLLTFAMMRFAYQSPIKRIASYHA